MTINKNIFFNYSSQILNSFFGLILSIYVARVLGPEGRGDLTIYNNSIIILGTWLSFSLNTSIVYFINSQIADRIKVINTIFIFTLFTTILVFFIGKYSVVFKLGWLILPIQYQNINWILIFTFHYLINQLIVLTNGILNAENIFIPQSVFNTVITLISVFIWLIVYHYKLNFGFDFAIALTFFLTVPPLLYNLLLIKRLNIKYFGFQFVNFIQFKQLLNYSMFIYACNALQMLTYRMDLWIMKFYHGSSQTGIYSLSVNMAQLIWILPGSISAVLYSELSKKNDIQSKLLIVNKYCKIAFASSIFFSICLFLVYYYFGPILYGDKFVDSRIYLGVLLFGIAPFSITTIIATFNAASNNIIYNFWTTFWGLISAIIFCFLLIPEYGALGAAFATVISYNACNFYILYIYKKRMNVDLKSLLISKSEIIILINQIKLKINVKSK